MARFPAEKEGKDCGLMPGAQIDTSPIPKSPNAGYNNQPADRDRAIWTDPCNFDHNLAHYVPMDGLDATVWELFQNKVTKT